MRNTTLCYLERDGQYLMLHRIKKENDENRDKWIGVGGKCEEGESPEECARREIREETGLLAGSLCYRALITFVSDRWGCEYMHLFTCSDFSGTMAECNEGVLEWVAKEHVCSLPVWEGDKLFLERIAVPSAFFTLKLVYRGDDLLAASFDGEKPALAVSACLLGERSRYDGSEKKNAAVTALAERYRLVPLCPELLGGLEVPRPACECRDDRVINKLGEDKTEAFAAGAEIALAAVRQTGCRCAVLKERSPSCGNGIIYDGTFTGTRIPGDGVTARLLKENGIFVLGESETGKL